MSAALSTCTGQGTDPAITLDRGAITASGLYLLTGSAWVALTGTTAWAILTGWEIWLTHKSHTCTRSSSDPDEAQHHDSPVAQRSSR